MVRGEEGEVYFTILQSAFHLLRGKTLSFFFSCLFFLPISFLTYPLLPRISTEHCTSIPNPLVPSSCVTEV